MPLLASESLLHEKKPVTKYYPNEYWTTDPGFQVQHVPPTLTGHMLLRRSLNFCSCTIWFLDDLVRVNRAWLYKDAKGLALQPSVQSSFYR